MRLKDAAKSSDEQHFHLRWFTPVTEVVLCGHATLASAHALVERQLASSDNPIHFHTLSGVLVATFEQQAQQQQPLIKLNFPSNEALIECSQVQGMLHSMRSKLMFLTIGIEHFQYAALSYCSKCECRTCVQL